MNEINIHLSLTRDEAWDLAQFLKRATFQDFRSNAADQDEAYRMIYASEKVRKALAMVGIDPR
jgi:hypothetical protein